MIAHTYAIEMLNADAMMRKDDTVADAVPHRFVLHVRSNASTLRIGISMQHATARRIRCIFPVLRTIVSLC